MRVASDWFFVSALVGFAVVGGFRNDDLTGAEKILPSSKTELVMDRFYAKEVVADDDYVYWTEAHVKEYDDEPVYIGRAAVKRRRHDGGAVEQIFDFKRDDIYCTPHRLGFVRGNLAWFCAHEFLDGNGRADSNRFMSVVDGNLHAVPVLPSVDPSRIASNGDEVFFIDNHREPQSMWSLDPSTGTTNKLTELPQNVRVERVFASPIAGGKARIFAVSETERRLVLWSLAPGDASELGSLDGGYCKVASSADRLFIGHGEYPSHNLWAFGAGEPELMHEARGMISPLRVHKGQLYFENDNRIQRLKLGTKVVTDVASAKQVVDVAVGGGWVYWMTRAHKLHRMRIPTTE